MTLSNLSIVSYKTPELHLHAIHNKEKPVYLKINLNRDTINEHRFDIEDDIYINVIVPLLEQRITPCLLNYIDSGVFRLKKLTEWFKNDQLKQLFNYCPVKDSRYYLKDVRALILERGYLTLYSWLEYEKLEVEIFQVLFQVYYTLACFIEVGLVHRDLHLGNIFVERIPQRTLYFKTKNSIYSFTTRWLVKIFDFDHSFKVYSSYPGFHHRFFNYYIYNYSYDIFGQKEIMDPRFDIYRFTTYIMNMPLMKSPRASSSLFESPKKIKETGTGSSLFETSRFSSFFNRIVNRVNIRQHKSELNKSFILTWKDVSLYYGTRYMIDPKKSEENGMCITPFEVLEDPEMLKFQVKEIDPRANVSDIFSLPSRISADREKLNKESLQIEKLSPLDSSKEIPEAKRRKIDSSGETLSA